MFAFVLLGAVAAIVLLVRPNPPVENSNLEGWEFYVEDRTGVVREEDIEEEESDNDDEETIQAVNSIVRFWKKIKRNQHQAAAAVTLQRWWRYTQTHTETPSEESYDVVDACETTSSQCGDDSDEEEKRPEEEQGLEEEKHPEESSATSSSSATTSSSSSDEEEEDASEWTARRGKGLRGFWRDVQVGLDDHEKRIGKSVYREAKRILNRGMIGSAWNALAGRGRVPPDVLDAEFCPERVRVRWLAPYVWMTGDTDFMPTEIEWTQSLQRWVQQRKRRR